MENKIKVKYERIVGVDHKGNLKTESITVYVSLDVAEFLESDRKRNNRENNKHYAACLPFHADGNTYHFHNHNKPHRRKIFLKELSIPDSETQEASRQDRQQEQKKIQDKIFALKQAIEHLPEKQRRRPNMYFFEGINMAKITQIEGVTPSAITQSIQSALITIKKFL